MDDLFAFTALIQLISAVNFANIKFHFHEKVFELLLDVQLILDEMFRPMESTISADIESLMGMDTMETKNNRSLQPRIDRLIREYQGLSSEWNIKKQTYYTTKENCIQAQGIKSFFLFISLYCIYDLALIALIPSENYADVSHVGLFVLNISSLIVSIGFCIRSCFHKKNKPESALYTIAIILSIVSLILVFCAVKYWGPFILEINSPAIPLLSILLPFAPCLWCFVYVVYHIFSIRLPMRCRSISIRWKQYKLHREKKQLDDLHDLFSDISSPPATFG